MSQRRRSLRRTRHSFTSERRVRRAFSRPRFEDDDSGELRDGLMVGAACGAIGGVLLIGMIGVACLGYGGSGDGTLRPPSWRAAAPVALLCPPLGMLIGALAPWARTPARQIALTTLGTLPFVASLALLDGGIDTLRKQHVAAQRSRGGHVRLGTLGDVALAESLTVSAVCIAPTAGNMSRNERKGRAGRKGFGAGHGLGEPWTFPDPSVGTPLERASQGAIMGGFGGCLALVVGTGRAGLAWLAGQRITFGDFQWIIFYLGAFVLAGALVGLLLPMRRTRPGRYALGFIGAGVAILVMIRGFWGPFATWDGAAWFSAAACTLIFGVVLARHLAD